MQVSVIGSSTATPEIEEYIFAYRLGQILGERGITVVCGGRDIKPTG